MDRRLLESLDNYSGDLYEGLFDDLKAKISKAREDHIYKKNQGFRDSVRDESERTFKQTMGDATEDEKKADQEERKAVDAQNNQQNAIVLLRFFTDYFQKHKKDLLYTEVDEKPEYTENSCTVNVQNNKAEEKLVCQLDYPTQREAYIRLGVLSKDIKEQFEDFLKNYREVNERDAEISMEVVPSKKKNDTVSSVILTATLERKTNGDGSSQDNVQKRDVMGNLRDEEQTNTPWREEIVDTYSSTIKEDGQEKPFDVDLIKQPTVNSRKILYIVKDNNTGKTLKNFFGGTDEQVVHAFRDWCDAQTSKVFEVSSPSKEFVLVKVQNSNGNSNKPIVFCIQDKNNSYFRMQINTNNENEARTAFNDWMNDNKQFEFGSCNKVPSELQNFYDSGQNEFVLCRERGVDNEFVVCNNNADFDPHTFKQGAKENIIKFKGPYPRAEKEYIDWLIRASKRKQARNSKKKKR